MANNGPLNIGTDRQLFVDDFWIDESKNTNRLLHQPTRRDPVIEKDYPWEQGFVGAATIAYDGDKYRMPMLRVKMVLTGPSPSYARQHLKAQKKTICLPLIQVSLDWTKIQMPRKKNVSRLSKWYPLKQRPPKIQTTRHGGRLSTNACLYVEGSLQWHRQMALTGTGCMKIQF